MQRKIIRDEKGRIVVPIPQKTNKRGLAGRPSKMTPIVLERLRQAFSTGCTMKEACAYADCSFNTYYYYMKKHPEFAEEIERLKQQPILKAKSTIVKNLDNVEVAKWYLSKKKRDEFGDGALFELNDNRSVNVVESDPKTIANLMKALETMKANLLKSKKNDN